MWTKNFQMLKLDLEKEEEPEIKLPASVGSLKKQKNSRKTSTYALLELPCFIHDPTNVSNLISGFSAFSKPSLYIWKFLVHILWKPSMKDSKHNLPSMWNEHSCTVLWTFFGIGFLWETRKFLKRWKYQTTLPVSWKTCIWVKKQQLEPDM